MEIIPLTMLGLGFLLGIRHAFDADHIAAVATMVSKKTSLRKSSELGLIWGMGHTLSLLALGIVFLLLRAGLPKNLAVAFEIMVAVMLIVLGSSALYRVIRQNMHLHQHSHGLMTHSHPHTHLTKSHSHMHKPFFIGIIHGLAGSAVLSLLVLGAIGSVAIGLLYIALFGLGSILGMILITGIISIPFRMLKSKAANALQCVAGIISIILGFSMIYQFGGLL